MSSTKFDPVCDNYTSTVQLIMYGVPARHVRVFGVFRRNLAQYMANVHLDLPAHVVQIGRFEGNTIRRGHRAQDTETSCPPLRLARNLHHQGDALSCPNELAKSASTVGG